MFRRKKNQQKVYSDGEHIILRFKEYHARVAAEEVAYPVVIPIEMERIYKGGVTRWACGCEVEWTIELDKSGSGATYSHCDEHKFRVPLNVKLEEFYFHKYEDVEFK